MNNIVSHLHNRGADDANADFSVPNLSSQFASSRLCPLIGSLCFFLKDQHPLKLWLRLFWSPEEERAGRALGAYWRVWWRSTNPPLLSSRINGDEFELRRRVALSIEAGFRRSVSVQCWGVLGWELYSSQTFVRPPDSNNGPPRGGTAWVPELRVLQGLVGRWFIHPSIHTYKYTYTPKHIKLSLHAPTCHR